MVKEEDKKIETLQETDAKEAETVTSKENDVKETPEVASEASVEKKETPTKSEQQQRGQRGGRQQRPQKPRPGSKEEAASGVIERVVSISRVSKVVKGGKNFSFSALVISGDGNGQAGVGLGKSNEVAEAIKKGTTNAKRNYKTIKTKADTIPHEIIGIFKASRVLLKPASVGTGVIAGGPVRAVCDAIGIKNILTKSLGSRNPVNVVKAAMNGFERLRKERRK